MHIDEQQFQVRYFEDQQVVTLAGTMRLRDVRRYDAIYGLLSSVLAKGPPRLTLDFCGLEFLNSSGITMLGRFLVDARRQANTAIKLVGSKQRPWQARSLDTLRRIWSEVELEIGEPASPDAYGEARSTPIGGHIDADATRASSIFAHLANKQSAFEGVPFFTFLETDPPHEWVWEFIPGMGFWVKTFQDVLRMVRHRMKSEATLQVAQHILDGDAGHDDWFVRDLEALKIDLPTVQELFGETYENVRLGSYAIVAEIHRHDDDILLLVLLLALESASYVFFTAMAAYLERNEFPTELLYFGRTHLRAELEHGIVESGMDTMIDTACARDPGLHAKAVALVENIFEAFRLMFVGFLPTAGRTDAE